MEKIVYINYSNYILSITSELIEEEKIMPWNKFKYIYIALFLVFIFSGTLSYLWMANPKPQNKLQLPTAQEPQKETSLTITNETKVIFQEKYKVCQKYNLGCEPSTKELSLVERKQLNGLTIKELEQLFNKPNWQVISNLAAKKVTVIQILEGLCPEHKKIWHLGLNNSGDYIAVFYGPSEVKNEGGIYKVTEIPISHLSPVDQEKIRNYEFEFYQEDELVAILDSFSEFLD